MTNSSGQAITGSGTNAIHLSGTLAQIDADLATLSYNAPAQASTGDISVNVWNQAGVSTTQTIAVNNLLPGSVTNNANHAILSATNGGSLTGSGAGDTFYFTPQNTGNAAKADHIADFSQASSDKIDLHGFGLTAANFTSSGSLSGSKSFTFVQGTDTSGHPYTLVEIETNGSHTPQYEIQLDNTHATLHASDFTLRKTNPCLRGGLGRGSYKERLFPSNPKGSTCTHPLPIRSTARSHRLSRCFVT